MQSLASLQYRVIPRWVISNSITLSTNVLELTLQPVTEVNFPSVTLCNANGLDTGEYVRNVFNNLEFNDANKSKLLREDFKMVLDDLVTNSDTESVFSNFMDKWMRYDFSTGILDKQYKCLS